MRFLATRLAAICCALAGMALAGDPYNITVTYQQNGTDRYARAWYGDGNLYIGSTVPSSVKTAFNFTAPNDRADFLYITPLGSGSSPAPSIPDPTFIVVNNAPNATAPVFFSHSAVNLSSDDVFFWLNYETLLFPILQDGSIESFFLLDGTDTPGTYIVKWETGGVKKAANATDSSLVGVSVELVTRSLA